MHPVLKWAGAIAVVTAVLVVMVPVFLYVASEAVIERRYPLPAIEEPAAPSPKTVERGFHLAQISGCSDCHGADFNGRLLKGAEPLRVWSSNLRLSASAHVGRRVPNGRCAGASASDATSLWANAFRRLRLYERRRCCGAPRVPSRAGPRRPDQAPTRWDRGARLALLEGRIVPAVLTVRDSPSSLDLGPRYDGGRYLARISCGECHGTNLAGSLERNIPDLDVVSLYSRAAFFDLLRRGIGAHRRHIPAMMRLSFDSLPCACRLRNHDALRLSRRTCPCAAGIACAREGQRVEASRGNRSAVRRNRSRDQASPPSSQATGRPSRPRRGDVDFLERDRKRFEKPAARRGCRCARRRRFRVRHGLLQCGQP